MGMLIAMTIASNNSSAIGTAAVQQAVTTKTVTLAKDSNIEVCHQQAYVLLLSGDGESSTWQL